MAETYEPFHTTTLGSAVTNFTISSISSSYTDIILVMRYGCSAGADILIRFNGDSGTNYNNRYGWNANGSPTSFNTGQDTTTGINPRTPANQPTSIGALLFLEIFDYRSSLWKSTMSRHTGAGGSGPFTSVANGTWMNTSAITSITLVTNSAATFAVGTTVTLYGILKA
jgi:hypothetical protein